MITAMVVQAIDTVRHAAGTRDFLIKPPRVARAGVLRRWSLQLWHYHSVAWLLHPMDFTRRTRYRINLPQALLLLATPWFALSLAVAIIFELCRRHKLSSAARFGDVDATLAGAPIQWIQSWHIALVTAVFAALIREILGEVILRSNAIMQKAELRTSGIGKLVSIQIPRDAIVEKRLSVPAPMESAEGDAGTVGVTGVEHDARVTGRSFGFFYRRDCALSKLRPRAAASRAVVPSAETESLARESSSCIDADAIAMQVLGVSRLADQFQWVPVLSAHSLRHKDVVVAVYACGNLARAPHSNRLRPCNESIPSLRYVEAPSSAYSEKAGASTDACRIKDHGHLLRPWHSCPCCMC